MKLFLLLVLAAFGSNEKENVAENSPENEERYELNSVDNPILVKIEEEEYVKVNKKSDYIGVTYDKQKSKWRAQRWSRDENTTVYNGYYDDEETTAHASDTLARKLTRNGKQKLKLNFPDNHTEIYPEKDKASKYIGVSYKNSNSRWCAQRWHKDENANVHNGYYYDEETAAHASDTLARKLMDHSKQKLKLNFPDDHTEVYPEKDKTSKYIGVIYNENESKWKVRRRNKDENKTISNGQYDDEEKAAHASDTLAIKLMANGQQKLKLNFPDDHIEVYPEKKSSKFVGVTYDKEKSKWRVQRWSKNENKMLFNGCYYDEETAAHASDTLIRKLTMKDDQKLKLNFPDDYTEVYPEIADNQKKKRKRPKE